MSWDRPNRWKLTEARWFAVCLGWLIAHTVFAQSRYVEEFPTPASKKGLQVEWVEDALALGVKHAALNLNLSLVVDPKGTNDRIHRTIDGEDYYFRRTYVESMDEQIRRLSNRGVLIYVIVLAYQSEDPEINRLMLHPDYSTRAPNRLGAFNTTTSDGRRWWKATLEFLSERWSRTDRAHGRVVGYIIGNEVNSHWWWSHRGRVSMREFADDYLSAVRSAHQTIRKQSSWARVYVSLEHHWNIRYPAGDDRQCFPGKAFLEYFADRARTIGDFDWHLAYHPYPENLFNPRFWNDRTATKDDDTPRITFKNLPVLLRFLEKPTMRFEGGVRRVILSEQGFHTPEGPDGEAIQAAAYCAAYREVQRLGGIDAFILHRHIDHPDEGGLRLGLRGRSTGTEDQRPKKRIYDCFRLADQPSWREAFEFALPIVGKTNWAE